jgi:hypothetical protein
MNPLKAMGLTLNDYSVEELYAAEVAAARVLATRAKAETDNEKAMHARTQQARAIAFYDKAQAEKRAAAAQHQAKDYMFYIWLLAVAVVVIGLWAFSKLGGLAR